MLVRTQNPNTKQKGGAEGLKLPLYSLDFRVWTEELGVKVGGRNFLNFKESRSVTSEEKYYT